MVEPTPLHPAGKEPSAAAPASPPSPPNDTAASAALRFDNRGKVIRPAFPRQRKADTRLNPLGRPGPRLTAAERPQMSYKALLNEIV